MTKIEIRSLRTGALAPLGPRALPSGIVKSQVAAPVALTATGFAGDRQGDTRHGGVEKAVHHYPFEHYATWIRHLGPLALLEEAGAFGENLSTTGIDERTVAIGDVFGIGTAVIEVSQGRQPCWRLNERFGLRTMAYRVQNTGMTGWYYRVRRTGVVKPADTLTLLDRSAPAWTIHRLWHALYVDPLNRGELEAIEGLERLAPSWKSLAKRRLANGCVEDWTARLEG